jgi:hypothetical protein
MVDMESLIAARQEMQVNKQKIMTNIKATNSMTDKVRASQEETRTAMRAGQENMMVDSEESKYMTSAISDRLYEGRESDRASRIRGQPTYDSCW